MENKKVPQLRFSGFEDEWEEKIFQDLFERRMERNNGQFGYDRWISVAKMYFQEPEKVTSNNIDTRTYVMRKSDIAFEGHSNKEFKLGRFVENDIGDGVISELFPIYKHKDEYDLCYWKYAIQNENIMFPKLTKCIEVSYTSSNKLDENFFLSEKILVPILREQQKIGAFLSSIDSFVQAKTQILESLKSVKKSLLQKCFPKDGEKVPQMRFEGFSGNWGTINTKEVGKIFIGLVTTMTKYYRTEGYLLIRNSDIKNNRFDFSENPIYLEKTFAERNKSRIHKIGDVITVHTGDVGTSAVIESKEDGSFGFATIVTRPNSNVIDSYYLSVYLNSDMHKKFAVGVSTGDGRTNYNLSNYYELNLPIPPTIEEQRKIANIFTKYESLIFLKQKEIDNLKTIKKSLLQKMFI